MKIPYFGRQKYTSEEKEQKCCFFSEFQIFEINFKFICWLLFFVLLFSSLLLWINIFIFNVSLFLFCNAAYFVYLYIFLLLLCALNVCGCRNHRTHNTIRHRIVGGLMSFLIAHKKQSHWKKIWNACDHYQIFAMCPWNDCYEMS